MNRKYAAAVVLLACVAVVAVCRGDVPDGKGGWTAPDDDALCCYVFRGSRGVGHHENVATAAAPEIEYTADQAEAFVAMFGAKKIRATRDGDDVIPRLPIRIKPGDVVTAYPDGSFSIRQKGR